MNLNFVEFVFLFYMFIGLYMISLFCIIYISNRKEIFYYPLCKPEPISIVMPCYNESKTIGEAIESLLNLNYPKDMIEIIVVDDKSTDNSAEVVREYTKRYSNVRLIINNRNSGKAAEPTNIGVLNARYNYVAVADADSFPEKDALIKMLGFLQEDKSVGAVTCSVLSKKPVTFMQYLQSIEYTVIAFGRKLLDIVDSVYVTPGPFALYRKSVLKEIGLFDTENMTQDIEIVWRMLSHNYKARMSLDAVVYSQTPNKFKAWFKQRIRWNIGGTQTLMKYRGLFFRKGMLGAFILPFFSLSLFLGLMGLGLFIYLLFRRLFIFFLSSSYSIYANSTIIRLEALNFSPSVLNFFGIVLFLLGTTFTLFGLYMMKDKRLENHKFFNILFYLSLYLAVYPVIMVTSLYKFARGKYSW